jgi:cytochrome c-type biogenesis protein CcmH/NrfF
VRRRRSLAAALIVAAALGGSPAVVAAATCPRTTALAVEAEVMCTVCGVPLLEATEAPQAQRERAFITRLIDRCRSKAQIKAELAKEFGPAVLALPPSRGFSDAAYLIPVLASLLGSGLIAIVAWRWRRRSRRAEDDEEPGADPLDAASAARLEADLARYGR